MVSPPIFLRNAAASKVRNEVRKAKLLVSSTMPASMASASRLRSALPPVLYCASSHTSSEAEEA